MKVQYTFDTDQNLYIARGFAESVNCHFYASGKSITELEQDLSDVIETAFMDKAEEYNSVQESLGSFTKFVYPKPILEKVNLDDYIS